MVTMMLLWFDVDTMNVSDINRPSENDRTIMPAINDIKESEESRCLSFSLI